MADAWASAPLADAQPAWASAPLDLPPPDTANANRSFGRVLMDGFTAMARAGARTAQALQPSPGAGLDIPGSEAIPLGGMLSLNTAAEATANTVVGLGAFPAALIGAPLSVAHQWLSGGPGKDETLAQAFDRIQSGISGPLYEESTPQGKQLTDQLGALLNGVLMPIGAHMAVHPALPEKAAAAFRELPPAVQGELARKITGQTVDAADMSNVAKIIANGDPAKAANVEGSLRTTYDQTGLGPFTIAEEAKADPKLAEELAQPGAELPARYQAFTGAPEAAEGPVPGDGAPLLNVEEPGTIATDGVEPPQAPDREATNAEILRANKDATAMATTIEDAGGTQALYQGEADRTRASAADAPPDVARHINLMADMLEATGKMKADEAPSDQPSSATYRLGAGTLNAGLNPAAVLDGIRDSYTPFVGVEADHAKPPAVDSQGQPVSRLGDGLRKILAPATRGDLAVEQAGIMRANFGEMAHQRELALESVKHEAEMFDKMPVEENVKFIDAVERGTKLTDPKLADAATALRELLDNRRDEVQALGKGQLENFDENYFPHMWKDPDAAQALYARRPLTGSGAFLKERTIPLTTDGLRWRAYDGEGEFVKSFDTEAEAKAAAGTEGRVGAPLKPITTNPVEMALLKVREMDKYVYGQKIFAEMKDADLARFVPFGESAPPGWTKINDKIARVLQPNEGEGGGMILRGEYYAPDEAATLINNHLSPGLQGNTFYQLWRGIGNAMNGLQLGLSLFHVGFTTMDSMISKVALGMKQISRGDIVEGAGNALQGLNPAQPFVNILKGDKLLRAYLGKLDDPSLAPIVDAIVQAGGRVKMDDFYRNEKVNTFKQALRNDDYAGAAKAFLPTVLDRIGAPIFEQLVPRQKLGVFFDMAKDWLEQNPRAGVNAKREGLGKLWDSVDNRMGQLVYDNVFWNRALKDGLMATVRSVGWNLGTFRELGGGLMDVKDIAANKGFSDRTAYVVALPLVAAIYGSVMHYAYNGTPPETLKDAFYPRTGRIRPDGSPDRVSLPTYMKDVYAYGEDLTNFARYGSNPLQTVANKMHPLIATIGQMLNNQDFFGGAIRNPADPAVRQLADEARYLLQQVEPFSYRNYIQQSKEKGEEPTAVGYITSPSMIGVAPAPGYVTKTPEQLESAQVSKLHDPLVQKYKEAIRNGADVDDKLIGEMVAGGLSRGDIRYVIKSSQPIPKPARLKKFGEPS